MATPNDSQQPFRLAYSVQETADAAGVSRDLIHKLIRQGDLHTVKLGERRLVPATEVLRITGTATHPPFASGEVRG